MTDVSAEPLRVVVERDLPFPAEKIWRALTQPHLIEEWLMKGDFAPVLGHRFSLRADWGKVDCEVRAIEEHRRLAYTWGDTRLDSVVTWTLTPTAVGTRLRMEQVGFKPDQPRYYQGAQGGWPRHFDALERVLEHLA